MFQYTSQADEKDWILGPYEGVKLKILHKDEKTGGLLHFANSTPELRFQRTLSQKLMNGLI